MKKVIAVCGPTAVGKTRMGVSLAEALHGEVISGDSMQIYRTMDIGTAKVTEEEMQGIIHHMIDIKNPDETFSVSEFQKEVRHYIDTIDMPIVVGGTGLYIKGALYDYTFEETESKHDEIKAKYDYNYLAVIFYLYGDISAASEYNKKRFILAERKKMLTFCSNSVNILEQ